MAKQLGEINVTGTLGGITFYKKDGQYYAKAKSSLNKKRVMKDKAFARSRERMADFAVASRFCSTIYRSFSKQYKGQGIQQKMTGRAQTMFLAGMSEDEVRAVLMKEFGGE